MTFDSRWKLPQTKTLEAFYDWAFNLVRELRSGTYLPAAVTSLAASAITYDNTTSGLTADDVQDAIDEVEDRVDTLEALPGPPWTTVFKAADETRQSDTTLTNDDELLFAMLANTDYVVRGQIFYQTTNAADFKSSFSGPASPTLVNIWRAGLDPGQTGLANAGTDETYGVSISQTGVDGFGMVTFGAIIRNGANAGNFAFQWAQHASSATDTIVRAGSWLEYHKLA